VIENQSGLISEVGIDITKLRSEAVVAKPLDKNCDHKLIICDGSRLQGQMVSVPMNLFASRLGLPVSTVIQGYMKTSLKPQKRIRCRCRSKSAHPRLSGLTKQISALSNQTATQVGATTEQIRLTTGQVNRLVTNLNSLVTTNRTPHYRLE